MLDKQNTGLFQNFGHWSNCLVYYLHEQYHVKQKEPVINLDNRYKQERLGSKVAWKMMKIHTDI